MSTRRIAYLSSEYPAISHTFIFREIQAVRKEGYEVVTATINPSRHVDRMTADEQQEVQDTLCIKSTPVLRVVAIHLGLLLRAPGRYFAMLGYTWRLWRTHPMSTKTTIGYFAEAAILLDWMRRQGVSHVHVHFANPAASVAMVAACTGEISFSLSVHGPDIFYNVDTGLLAEKLRHARFVRCITHFCRSQVQRLLPHGHWGKCAIVRCGVDLEKYAVRPQPGNSVTEILCVGRLVSAKGQHVLLLAAKRLQERNVPFHLTFVGGGPDQKSLEALASELGLGSCVEFAGVVGQDQIHAYYDKADIFVLPSFAEGLPVVLMESMAKGILSVSTRITGIPEMMHHGENSLLTAASDWEGLAECLQEAIERPEYREELAARGRQIVEADYDIRKNCAKMASLFQQYLDGGES